MATLFEKYVAEERDESLKRDIKGIVKTCRNSYSGTLKKTFQITPYDIQQDSKKQITGISQDIVVKYTKGGRKPSIELSYNGTKMTAGKDYLITYKNNKAVTTSATTKQPIIITEKGNFKGSLSRSFTITQRDFNDRIMGEVNK